MKKIKLYFLALPMYSTLLCAAGIGVSGSYSSISDDLHNNYKNYNTGGVGFVFDTNLGKDRTFNYRLGFEYMRTGLDDSIGDENYDYVKRINVVNTFGFGFYRSQSIRLWAAPRILISEYTYKEKGEVTHYNFSNKGIDVGVGPALGININFDNHLTLSLDADYMAIFSSTNRAITTLRVSLIFRFDEIAPIKQ